MEFRKMISSDAREIAEIEEISFPDPYSERSIKDLLCCEGAMCFTAVESGRVVAYFIGRIIAPEGEIYRIAVLPEYRRRGLGYRLLDYSVKTSRGAGLEVLFLEVRESNSSAFALYKSYGFKILGRRRDYYRDPKEDAIVMLLANKQDMYSEF